MGSGNYFWVLGRTSSNMKEKKRRFHCKNCAFGEHLSERPILSRQNTSSPTYDDTCLPELCFGNTTSEGIPYCFRAGLVWVFWVIYARRLHPASGSFEIVSLRVKLWHFVWLFDVFQFRFIIRGSICCFWLTSQNISPHLWSFVSDQNAVDPIRLSLWTSGPWPSGPWPSGPWMSGPLMSGPWMSGPVVSRPSMARFLHLSIYILFIAGP